MYRLLRGIKKDWRAQESIGLEQFSIVLSVTRNQKEFFYACNGVTEVSDV